MRALEIFTATGLCALTACFPSFSDDCIDNGCPGNQVCLLSGECDDPGGGGPDAGVPTADGGVTVVAVDPEANSVDGDPDAIEVTFSQGMRGASAENFLVRSSFDGRLAAGTYVGGSSSELIFSPSAPLRAGSRAEVTLRTTLQAVSGAPLQDPFVFQYRAATAPSNGRYAPLAPASGRFVAVGALRVGDFDGDGAFEAFFTAGSALASILAADIDRTGAVTLRGEAVAPNADALDFDAGDVNGDGRTDLVAASFEDQGSRVWFGEDGGAFRRGPVIVVGRPLKRIRLGDLDGDGDLDFAAVINVGAQGPGENVLVALGNGNGTFAVSSPLNTLPDAGSAHDLRLADMDNDGQLDVVVLNDAITRGDGSVVVLENDGRGAFGDAEMDKRGTVGQVSDSMAVGDLNGDGFVDVAVGQRLNAVVSILLNDGDGGFLARSNVAVGAPDSLAMADVDGDGDLDVITSAGQILENVASNGELVARPGGFAGGRLIGCADVDEDRDLDVVSVGAGPDRVTVSRND